MSGAFEGERAVVIGAGVAGRSAALVLAAEGAEVRISDARPRDVLGPLDELQVSGVRVLAGGHEPEHLDGASLVVVSPGIGPYAPVIAWARERGLPVLGELELGARLLGAPVIAITGTNGKTTTTEMIAVCLRESGLDAKPCGNIGDPFPAAAREPHDVLVVECSSFQLAQQTSFHPRVSVLLNLAPDHLDWHGSFDSYAASKRRIFQNQRGDDIHIGNRDDPDAASISASATCRVVWFSVAQPGIGEVGVREGRLWWRTAAQDRFRGAVVAPGGGFVADAAAAASAALAFGASPEAVTSGLAGYRPAAHRGETVAEFEGVRFIDNSKATNVHAALAAIDGVDDAVLIAGGRSKGADLAPLASRAERLRGVVAIGEAASELAVVFEGSAPVRHASSIEEAVRIATTIAHSLGSGTVLLAPACASWDQFADYAERGARFAAAARELGREALAHG